MQTYANFIIQLQIMLKLAIKLSSIVNIIIVHYLHMHDCEKYWMMSLKKFI